MTRRVPAEAFPPGEYLKDELEARDWTQSEFAQIIGRSVSVVNGLISGKRPFTPDVASLVAAALGTSAMLWMNLESEYRLTLSGPVPERVAKEARLRELFPVRDLLKRKWVTPSEGESIEQAVLRFYQIPSITDRPAIAHAAKRSNTSEELTSVQLAWLLRVRQIAEVLQVPPYKEQALRARLDDLRALTTDPEEIRHVPRILAECGVRFVIVEQIAGSKIDGVCTWVNNQKSPVIGMTLRLDRIDNFWFVLRHEIEHVLQGHGKGSAMLDVNLDQTGSDLSDEERVANDAAGDFCVPRDEMKRWITRVHPIYSEERLVGFAERMGIHPGIVAGQLRRHLDRYDLFQKYLAKVRPIVTRVAITDGYGHVNSVLV